MSIFIRQLTENDWREFSHVRLKALQTDPNVFGSNYEKESKQTEAEWRDFLQSKDLAVFMIFDGDEPIGMTGVAVWREDETKKTALLWGSWLEPHARGKGLSNLMYESRIEWAKAHPTVERIIVSHRASNLASKHANQNTALLYKNYTKKRGLTA